MLPEGVEQDPEQERAQDEADREEEPDLHPVQDVDLGEAVEVLAHAAADVGVHRPVCLSLDVVLRRDLGALCEKSFLFDDILVFPLNLELVGSYLRDLVLPTEKKRGRNCL